MNRSATNTRRWRRANELFERVLDLPAAQRIALIDQACADDPELRAEVERRLRADAEAGAFLDQPLVSAPNLPVDLGGSETEHGYRPADSTPDRLGPYRILHEIGRGGMGTVYAAERDDDAFHRKVAIKVITTGTENEDVVRRMRAERRILALLEHPNIAAIHDGGSTPSGLPYFVMEHVEGESIDRYCATHKLSIHARVELLVKVCSAVDYANRNLVVHRDLKPSNILVTPAGEPKLLDFGIAKVLASESASPPPSAEATAPWRQRLTLNYASPEQIRGHPVSTASDVYALGVMLYRLLTGALPHVLEGLSPWEAENRLSSEEPPRPSTAVLDVEDVEAAPPGDPRQVANQLHDDLDPIALKALRTDPDSRFRSAGELADDLKRYLNGFPVEARQGTFRYRAGKLLRRHKLATALATVALVLGGLFFGSVILSANQLTRSQGKLLEERAKLQEVVDFFLGVFEEAGPYVSEGVSVTVREAVDRHASRVDDSLESQPTVLAAVLSTLGWVYLDLGQPVQALSYHQRALDLRQEHFSDSLEVAESLDGVGAALRDQGKVEQAAAPSTDGLSMTRQRQDASPNQLLRSLNNRVNLLCVAEEWAAAAPLSAEALAIGRRLADQNHLEITKAIIQRATVLRNLGDVDRARELYLQTVSRYETHYGPTHPALATLFNNLGALEAHAKRFSFATDFYRRADDQFVASFGDDYWGRLHPLTGLGQIFVENQQFSEAEKPLRQALDVFARSPAFAPEHEIRYLGRPAVLLGQTLAATGRCPEAVALLDVKVASWQDEAEHWIVRNGAALLNECKTPWTTE